MPEKAMQDGWKVQVAANSPKTAHTWKQRTSVMSPGRSCDGGPRRAVQNQVFWCTECHRKTVPYRIRSSVVQDGLAGQFGTENGPVAYARFIFAPGPHAAVAAAQVVMWNG